LLYSCDESIEKRIVEHKIINSFDELIFNIDS
jgi:hypothetical protein